MPIPPEILAVERPRNSVVYAYGKNRDRYGVRMRVGCRRVNGRNVPVNGPTIGHIIDGKYVPLPDTDETQERPVTDVRDWADVTLAAYAAGELFADLLTAFDEAMATTLVGMAILRALNPGIADEDLEAALEASVLAEDLAGINLSSPSVRATLEKVGHARDDIDDVMLCRADRFSKTDTLVVDATFKDGWRPDSVLGALEGKDEARHGCATSALYAYAVGAAEPVCATWLTGEMPDETDVESFVRNMELKRALILGTTWLDASDVDYLLKEAPSLHHLTWARGDQDVVTLLKNAEPLAGMDAVPYAMREDGKRWYYAFRDQRQTAREREEHRDTASGKATPTWREPLLGTKMLSCDIKLDPGIVWRAWRSRPAMALIMQRLTSARNYAKSEEDGKRIIGSEFVDFLATIIACRLAQRIRQAGVTATMRVDQVMRLLGRARMTRVDGGEWKLCHLSASDLAILRSLGLVGAPKPARRRGGRPRKG